MGSLALLGGTVIASPTSEPLPDAALLIEGDAIARLGPRAHVTLPDGCTTVDCTGALIVAGFWNCHVHFFERKWVDAAAIPASELAGQLQVYTRFGFTTVFDLSSSFANTCALRARVENGEIAGPSILTTGGG